jgi:light-harvesting complex 1 beta chain
MATGTEDRGGSLSGLTAAEAREFHRLFVTSFIGFTVVALIAHFLAWMWRPWLPGEEGYSALLDGVQVAAHAVLPYLA